MIRTQIQITEEQAKRIRDMAAARHLSVAEVIRQAVDAAIKSSAVADAGERRRRALEIAGKFRSGRQDVSRRHDKHLAESFRR